MAREPEKVNSACLRTNRVEITRRLHLDSSILLLDRERWRKYTVDERDASCKKSRNDLVSVRIFSEFSQFLPRSGAEPRDLDCDAWQTSAGAAAGFEHGKEG